MSKPLTRGKRRARTELQPVWRTHCLSRGGDQFELHGAGIADGRVASLWVVKKFDVVEHVGTGLVAGALDLAGGAFGFQ
jgi:hypothetical protein